ncbi:hypothetical protein BGX34_006161 [Mortierella sp. NVP85]|nr:hypothetical protein BGX34_006161 [Mortierella sp. NVP85]
MHRAGILSLAYFASLSLLKCFGTDFLVQAQPQPCGGPAFAKVGNKFYIQGGATSGDNLLTHFWALDLTKPWTTSKPEWTILAPGPYNAYHSAGYSADNKTFVTFGRNTGADVQVIPPNWVNVYDIQSNVWTFAENPSSVRDISRRDFYAVSDPDLNKIYVLGGNAGPEGAIASNAFDVYDPVTKSTTEIDTPRPGPQNISTYSAVWLPRLKAMIVFGGYVPKASAYQGLYLYTPSTKTWTTQTTTGTFNYNGVSHCAAANADGSLVAVFGGFINFPGAAEPTVSVLDTRTWKWVTLPYNGRGRGNAACTISEDTFIIWGGFFNAPNTVMGVPLGADALLLFSLTNMTFHTTYTPSDALTKSNPPGDGTKTNPDPSGGESKNGSGGGGLSTGVIGGIAAGCVALLLVAAFTFLDRRRRRKKYDKPFDPSNHGTGTGSGPGYPDMSTHYDQIAAGPRPLTGQFNQGRPTSATLLHPRHSMQSMDGGNSSSIPTTPSTMYFMNEHGGVEAPLMVPGGGTSPIRYSGRQSQSYPVDPSNPGYYPQPLVAQQPVIPEEDYRNTYANSNVSVDRRSDPQSVPIVGGGRISLRPMFHTVHSILGDRRLF